MGIRLIELDHRLSMEGLAFSHVLFLDIDGVLHPDGPGEYADFSCLKSFCDALRTTDPIAKLPIVMSSAWRHTKPLEKLKSYFPVDIASRFVGVTPDAHDEEITIGPEFSDGVASGGKGVRQLEIVPWMKRNAPTGQWLAIDDRAGGFEANCSNLFVVPGTALDGSGAGITDTVGGKLRARLKDFLAPA
jgi:hypothetical protein